MGSYISENFCGSFISFCRGVADRRQPVKRVHSLEEVLFLGLCAVCSGCSGWRDIHFFGETHTDFLRKYLPYAHGIASPSTIMRVFSSFEPEAFSGFFTAMFSSVVSPGDTVGIDGKTVRGSCRGGKTALHTLHACASEHGLLIGFEATAEKSNEITAAPALIEKLALEGTVVTADAMLCQRDICAAIIAAGGDYVIALKKNQGTLYEDVTPVFHGAEKDAADASSGTDAGHGRVESRRTFAADAGEYLQKTHQWPGLASVVMSVNDTYDKTKKTQGTPQTRYFISSLPPDALRLSRHIRHHWRVESMHWQLDVSFREDAVAIAADNAADNLENLRKCALNLLNIYKKQTVKNLSIKRIQMTCLAKPDTLAKVFEGIRNYAGYS